MPGAEPRRKGGYWRAVTNGLWRENPVLRLALGVCPALAVTATALSSVYMGAVTFLVLLCANVTASLLQRLFVRGRTLVYMLSVVLFTALIQLLAQTLVPSLDAALGIYLPLVAVNGILIGRAEEERRTVGFAALDAVGVGAGFAAVLLLVGMVRELFGAGTLFGWRSGVPVIGFFALPAGGFFVFGLLLWMLARVSPREYTESNVAAEINGGESGDV